MHNKQQTFDKNDRLNNKRRQTTNDTLTRPSDKRQIQNNKEATATNKNNANDMNNTKNVNENVTLQQITLHHMTCMA